ESEVQVLHLADRVLPSEPAAQRLRREMRRVRRELCDVLVGELDRPRQLVDRAVVIGELEIVNLLILARARRQRDAVARAHEVRVDDLAAEDHALRLGVTELSAELPRKPFLDVELDVDEIGRAGHRHRLVLDGLDVRQPLQTHLRALERRVRKIRTFELTHLAAKHLVVDVIRAVEVDAPNVDAALRIDEERDVDRLRFRIELGHGLHLRERVAREAVHGLHVRLGEREQRRGEQLPFARQDRRAQLRVGNDHLAGDSDLAELVLVALADGDRAAVVSPIRRDRDTNVLEAEIRVTAVHVVRAQRLEIAFERFSRIAIVVSDERQQAAGRELELLEELLVVESLVADDVDLTNLRPFALFDLERDAHAVVRQFLDRRRDLRTVLTARVVLLGEIPLHLVEHRAVEGLAAREADVPQRAFERLVRNILVAAELELFDRRPLEHRDHERIAVDAQLDVLEEAGRIERADRLLHPLRRDRVADIDRQVVVDRAFGDSLRAFDAEIAYHERLERLRERLRAGTRGNAERQSANGEPPQRRMRSDSRQSHQLNTRDKSL